MKTNATKQLVYTAMLTAIIAVLAQIAIPLPISAVPISLATLGVLVCGMQSNIWSVLVYIALGAVGVPVFASFTGGLAIITGPTGGYIIGYAVMAIVISVLIKRNVNPFLAMIAGTICCYILGTAWFMIVTGNGLLPSLTMCVLPFLPGDALKIVAAKYISKALKPLNI